MRATLFAALVLIAGSTFVHAEEKKETFSVGEGKLVFESPEGWIKKEPRSRIIEAELEVPAAEGDEAPGRLTAMGAGGTVEANIERWVGQFEGTRPKVEKREIGGAKVHLVDLAGTYKDSPGGPFAGGKTVMRKDYRMLGAIIETKDAGNYFLKLYGPKATIAQGEKGFREMVEGLKVK